MKRDNYPDEYKPLNHFILKNEHDYDSIIDEGNFFTKYIAKHSNCNTHLDQWNLYIFHY